ncbi:MAG TPA: hypothetical protein VGM27_23740 [Acidobacteriaceae bacterium]
MYTSLIGALILARAVNDDDFAREILTEERKTDPLLSCTRFDA